MELIKPREYRLCKVIAIAVEYSSSPLPLLVCSGSIPRARLHREFLRPSHIMDTYRNMTTQFMPFLVVLVPQRTLKMNHRGCLYVIFHIGDERLHEFIFLPCLERNERASHFSNRSTEYVSLRRCISLKKDRSHFRLHY